MPNKFDSQHLKNVDKYSAQIDDLYATAIDAVAKMLALHDVDSLSDQKIRAQATKFFNGFNRNLGGTVRNGMKEEWKLSNGKNDTLVKQLVGNNPDKRYLQGNEDALQSFIGRQRDGLKLSDRVWNLTKDFKDKLEEGLKSGIGTGTGAKLQANDLMQYLNTQQGTNPGTGVYKDPRANARRLARTETNMAYHEADWERWQQMDFVIGYEVEVSNNGHHCPLCLQLQGKYPKWFKFRSWHPQCMCHATAILADDIDAPESDPNAVTQVPAGFAKWAKDNEERSKGKPQPYFVRDNFKGGKLTGGLLKPESVPVGKTEVKKGKHVPSELSKYEKELGVKINTGIFDHLKDPVPLQTTDKRGAYFSTTGKFVNIPIDRRRKNSQWWAEAVVYHEYGHAIDSQTGLFEHPVVITGMKDLAKKLSMPKLEAGYLKAKTALLKRYHSGENVFNQMEQAGSIGDTLMAINTAYGEGHSKAYFKIPGNRQKEFIAHMFENKFIGNALFKEIAPDLYDEMLVIFDKLF